MKAKKILTVVLSVILWLVIILAAVFAFTALATHDPNKVANLAGYTPLVVESDSMAPTFKTGDWIIIKQVDPHTLEVGDVITFHTIIENEFVLNTHRIESIESSGSTNTFTTKGDNNILSDTRIVSEGDVVGKYVGKIAGFGKVINFIGSPIGFLVLIVLPILVFFGYQVYNLIKVSIAYKKAVALETAEEVNKVTDEKMSEVERKLAEAEAKLAEAQRLKAEAENKINENKEKVEE